MDPALQGCISTTIVHNQLACWQFHPALASDPSLEVMLLQCLTCIPLTRQSGWLQELKMPFSEWLDKHKLHLIKPLFYETQTSQGYGFIDEVPTYYGVLALTSSVHYACTPVLLDSGPTTCSAAYDPVPYFRSNQRLPITSM